jgi:mannose-6-phosphate isomerase-like protein (cupin superfamily)
MKIPKIVIAGGAALTLVCCWAAAQQGGKEEASWAPKPLAKTVWKAPMKPHTKIAEVKAAHKGKTSWRHVIVDDDHLKAEYVAMAPGEKVGRRFHPDTREWWVITEGEVRFDIEGQDSFTATKGSMVQVPMQTIYSMEAVGDKPALRFEVNIANAHTLYPKDAEPPKITGIEWIPVTLGRKPMGYTMGNKPHINYHELVKDPTYKGSRFIHDDRAVSNIIYGSEKNLPPRNPKDRGHFHPECAEFWLIMDGQISYPMEYVGEIIANVGDVVYAPPYTFHAPRFHGDAPSCRLAMNGFTNIAHLRDAVVPH